MKYKPNAYLAKKNSSVYSVKVTIPPYKRSLFGNRTAFMRTTGTADIREARIIRDKVVHEFFALRDMLKPKPQRNSVDRVLAELRSINQHVRDRLRHGSCVSLPCPTAG